MRLHNNRSLNLIKGGYLLPFFYTPQKKTKKNLVVKIFFLSLHCKTITTKTKQL